MKKLVSIGLAFFLIVESLLPGMDVHELVKLPDLFQHYQKHREMNSDLDFVTFIKLHYENPKHHEQDHQTHHKLPFHNHHQNCSLHQVLFTIPDFTTALTIEPFQQKNKVEYEAPAKLNFYRSIWQPPRVG